jgi:crotonobetaine/carnitine-CoA ligase
MELEDRNQDRQSGREYPIFKTVEEMVAYTSQRAVSKGVLLQRADGASLNIDDYLRNLNRLCNMFLDLGVCKGSNVGVLLGNCLEYPYFYLALGRLGATIVPLNQFLKGETLSYVIDHCDITHLVSSKELYVDKIQPISTSITRVRCVIFLDEPVNDESIDKAALFDDFRNYPAEFNPPWSIEGSTPFVIWLTSGTTGLPKGVVCTQEYLLQRVSFSANYFGINSLDVIYFILPMYHIPFFCWGFPIAMISGARLVFVDWFSASKFWEHVAKHKATMVYSTGTIIPILLKKEINPQESEGKDSIRLWSAWPLDQPGVAYKRWPKTKFVEGYGLSEYALATITTHDKEEEATSQGPATPFTELKICDQETGELLPTGSPGEIVLRSKIGPGFMMQGYYKSPKETAETIRNGWLYSGDMGYLDEKNYLHFVDRLKDSVRVGGENVPSVQLEALIASHPKILEVAVVGAKGELGHDEIVAHVVLRQGEELQPDEFFQFCAQKMPYFMVPKHLHIRKDLPKTATYKIQKFMLREEGLKETYTREKIK